MRQCIQQLDVEINDLQNRYSASFEEIKRVETIGRSKEIDLKNEIDMLNEEVETYISVKSYYRNLFLIRFFKTKTTDKKERRTRREA